MGAGGLKAAKKDLNCMLMLCRIKLHLEQLDVGFVYEQQKASVKVDAFNFTKYGLIDGEVMSISEVAIEDENLGLFYSTRVKLSDNKMNIGGKWVNLSPGMTVAVEVKTGQRRLIEYFLSPILRHKQESIKER